MPVQERDFTKSPAAAGRPSGAAAWLARLNEIGERHATAIIGVSTALIILTVLLFAKGAYDRSQVERAEQDLAKAETIEILLDLKKKFSDTPVAPRIVYKLANKFADDRQLEKAVEEYRDFIKRFPTDAFRPQVDAALVVVERNLAFNADLKPVRLREHVLQSHPRQFPALKDPRLQFGPERFPNPAAEIQTPAGTVKIELFEDDAPNAVAAFVKLAGEKHFDGLKWEAIENGTRLRIAKKAGAPETLLAFEATPSLRAEAGSLVLVRKDADSLAGQFEILLRPAPGMSDVTVIGVVKDGLDRLKKDEAVTTLSITSKRAHPYEPAVLDKK